MSVGGTLIVAVAGGAVGSGLAIAGGLASQTRQHGFEREQWTRERMEKAAAQFGEFSVQAQRVFATVYEGEADPTEDLRNECVRLTRNVGDAFVWIHLAFGLDSPVVDEAMGVDLGMRKSLAELQRPADIQPAESSQAWRDADHEFRERVVEANAHIMLFTDAARDAIFLESRHKYATTSLWKRLRKPQ
jgi:hypothetical protein